VDPTLLQVPKEFVDVVLFTSDQKPSRSSEYPYSSIVKAMFGTGVMGTPLEVSDVRFQVPTIGSTIGAWLKLQLERMRRTTIGTKNRKGFLN